MTDGPRYATAAAFRAALEARLPRLARDEATDLQRLRRQLAFDRLLARVFGSGDAKWALKGGYAMEVRLREARTTKDLDLALLTADGLPETTGVLPDRLRASLQEAAARDLSDYFEFLVAAPVLEIDAAPYGGARFPIECRLAGRTFVRFHLDVGVGDVLLKPVEVILGRDWLSFAGVSPPLLLLVPREQQFAEKIHAYTLPDRPTPNSRVKDLVDLVLLIQRFPLSPERVLQAIDLTFQRRGTHGPPKELTPPPHSWAKPFAKLAGETGLKLDVQGAFEVARDYYERHIAA